MSRVVKSVHDTWQRLTNSVHIPAPVVNLAASFVLASYLCYGMVSLPAGVPQPDEMLWVYARHKVITGMVRHCTVCLGRVGDKISYLFNKFSFVTKFALRDVNLH